MVERRLLRQIEKKKNVFSSQNFLEANADERARFPRGKKSIHLQDCVFFKELQAFFFIEQIIVYGSRARGDYRKDSDLNLAINCPTATDWDWIRVLNVIKAGEIESLLLTSAVRLDELSSKNSWYRTILKEGILVYKRDPNRKPETRLPIRKKPTDKAVPRDHRFPDFTSDLMGVKALQFDEVYVDVCEWVRPPDIVPSVLKDSEKFFFNPHRYLKMPLPPKEAPEVPTSPGLLAAVVRSIKRFLGL